MQLMQVALCLMSHPCLLACGEGQPLLRVDSSHHVLRKLVAHTFQLMPKPQETDFTSQLVCLWASRALVTYPDGPHQELKKYDDLKLLHQLDGPLHLSHWDPMTIKKYMRWSEFYCGLCMKYLWISAIWKHLMYHLFQPRNDHQKRLAMFKMRSYSMHVGHDSLC